MFTLSYAGFSRAWRAAGQSDQAALADSGVEVPRGRYGNGALQASLALLTLGVPLPGTHSLTSGRFAGRRAFTGANRLADWLAQRYAPPETWSPDAGFGAIVEQLHGRRGILGFIQYGDPQGGLIGLLDGTNAQALCCAAHRRHPIEVRFWALH